MAYSTEGKASVIAKMLPPHKMPLGQQSREEYISEGTLSRWRPLTYECIYLRAFKTGLQAR